MSASLAKSLDDQRAKLLKVSASAEYASSFDMAKVTAIIDDVATQLGRLASEVRAKEPTK